MRPGREDAEESMDKKVATPGTGETRFSESSRDRIAQCFCSFLGLMRPGGDSLTAESRFFRCLGLQGAVTLSRHQQKAIGSRQSVGSP